MTIRVIAASALLALCACTGSFGERVHESFHQAIESAGSPIVHVDNIAGTVEIVTWPQSVVDVAATKYGYDAAELKSVRIGVRREGDGIFIATNYEGGNHSGGVRYRITVPQGASLDVGNVAGSVRVAAVAGNVTVETQAGTIDARLGRVDGDRSIDLRATTGAISLTLSSDSSASVQAESTVGAFSSDVPAVTASRVNLVGSRASGKLGGGAARIRLTTTTGAISLRTMQ
jgi:hypothetical protein